jgi:translin
LDDIARKVLESLEAKNAVREVALTMSRRLIQQSARSIRATHREEWEEAQALLAEAGATVATIQREVRGQPDIYFAGYTQDALKEFAEAHITYALITGQPLPDPDHLEVEYAAYLNGLGEAAGEMRRHVLDLIRRGWVERGERILAAMDEIYGLLVTVDYSDAITGGLRRTTDMVRGVVERTRGDLTLAVRQEKLQEALQDVEERMKVDKGPDIGYN